MTDDKWHPLDQMESEEGESRMILSETLSGQYSGGEVRLVLEVAEEPGQRVRLGLAVTLDPADPARQPLETVIITVVPTPPEAGEAVEGKAKVVEGKAVEGEAVEEEEFAEWIPEVKVEERSSAVRRSCRLWSEGEGLGNRLGSVYVTPRSGVIRCAVV
jgi:hypothetical protein